MARAPIYIASDHAGFERKAKLASKLKAAGYDVVDLGPTALNPDDDYPEFAARLARRVSQEGGHGILLCGNGQGICIAANKITGIRAVSAYTPEQAQTTRTDDDANILCLPGRFQTDQEVWSVVEAWLSTSFSQAERHLRRIREISQLEQ